MQKIEIIDLDPQNEAQKLAFKQINYEWINKYFKVEKGDLDSLENPEKYFLATGGAVLLARRGEEYLGTSALKPIGNDAYELCKMGVTESARGLGIGGLIGEAAVEKAKELGAKRLYLETNSSLTPALTLYEKLGFRRIENFSSSYQRADVAMEMWF
ncbi:GNAT family N-acetyltransferase [Emticicia sp. SJ17W-69]|uniref:GNAT family N-acetyltransferase n=1 Tax=Emticicia sp. SJ17W-69 TaxID=3421657 RepID=UPI003EBDD9E3